MKYVVFYKWKHCFHHVTERNEKKCSIFTKHIVYSLCMNKGCEHRRTPGPKEKILHLIIRVSSENSEMHSLDPSSISGVSSIDICICLSCIVLQFVCIRDDYELQRSYCVLL